MKLKINTMKKLFLLLLLGFTLVGFSQTTEIPDPNFEQALIDLGYDTAPIDGSVLTANISGVTYLEIDNRDIANLTGIEDFTALTTLYCFDNQLTSLDVSANSALELLNCNSNQLTSLDVSNNAALTALYCNFNQLTSLDVNASPALEFLYCYTNQLTSVDVSLNNALTELDFGKNQLTSLDVSNNTDLTTLYCDFNQLTSLDVNNNTALEFLYCFDNQLTSLDVSANTALELLNCYNNQLTSLDVRNGNNTNLSPFNSTSNPNLTCIYVDDASYSTANWTNIDPASTFVNNEAACEILSLGDNTSVLDVNIFPNPTANYLFIEGNVNPVSITIYNLLGAKVIATSNTDKIDVSELSNGVYIIKISDGIDQTDRKFIKN